LLNVANQVGVIFLYKVITNQALIHFIKNVFCPHISRLHLNSDPLAMKITLQHQINLSF